MTREKQYRLVLLAIGAVTVVSGLVQLFMPGFVLDFIGAGHTAAARHFFGIIGMFMVLFGGLLVHALLGTGREPLPVFWAGLQKLGAAGAVSLGVLNGIFGPLALLVAGFDLLSGVLIFAYLRYLRSGARRPLVA